ncbi:hypothetical protein GCM10010994_54910 [Chelatococcus reniformis]|uniref:Uncharacterized protein n=1 Tax=Chelatococcus reniformis TaxID=1494448 RepID=A0A916UW53_9HYPH|nr:hypothetical protein GCM10010994_54910 [Chelatococcus reniformis]
MNEGAEASPIGRSAGLRKGLGRQREDAAAATLGPDDTWCDQISLAHTPGRRRALFMPPQRRAMRASVSRKLNGLTM